MNTGLIITLIITASAVLGVIVFFIVRHSSSPAKISTLQNQLKAGKTSQTIRNAKRLLTKNPNSADAHYLLGLAYAQEGQDRMALDELKTVNSTGDFSGICREAEFRKQISSLYQKFGQHGEALKEYLLLIKLEPNEPGHYYNAGRLLEIRKHSEKAMGYYKKALQLNNRFADGWYAVGHLMYEKNRPREAKRALAKALELEPGHYKAQFSLGRIHKDAKSFQEALPLFESAQRDPELKVSALTERGLCLMGLKNYTKAQNELERAVKVSTDGSIRMIGARYALSLCYEHNRKIDLAVKQWEKIYTVNKSFRDVAERLSRYRDVQTDDRIKDFMTASPDTFRKLCEKTAGFLKLSVIDYKGIPEGAELTAAESERWQNKVSCFLRVLRTTESTDQPAVKTFYEDMRRSGANHGFLISSADFSRSAVEFSGSHPVELIPKERLSDILSQIQDGAKN